MLISISNIIIIIVVWYIICDRIASTNISYVFPNSCSRCDSRPSQKNLEIYRQWFFPHELLENVFPHAERTAEVPVCEVCFSQFEEHKILSEKISWWIAALSFIPLSYGVWKGNLCTSWSGSPILYYSCSIGFSLLFGFVFSLCMVFITRKVLCYLPDFVPPAHFNLLGKLRFYNKAYQQKFTLQNPNPEAQISQHQMPFGLMFGIVIVICLSAITDIPSIVDALISKSSILVILVNIVRVLGEIVSAYLVYRLKKLGILLWIVIVVADILLNANYSIEAKVEDLIITGAIIIIFAYEWWQTRRGGMSNVI